MSVILKDTIQLLVDIRENNNRPWFAGQKDRYDLARQNVKDFLADLLVEMEKIDQIEKNKLFRIYRDVRFSKDKTPYNSHWSMSLGRAKPYLRGGYYLKLNPEGAYLACGFWNPASSDMALIRSNIDLDDKSFRKAINHKKVKAAWGEMVGNQVKSAPRGYDKNHPSIDLLRFKQFVFAKEYSLKQMHQKDFLKEVVKSYKEIRPFFNYMSDILGHNLNGEPLYKIRMIKSYSFIQSKEPVINTLKTINTKKQAKTVFNIK